MVIAVSRWVSTSVSLAALVIGGSSAWAQNADAAQNNQASQNGQNVDISGNQTAEIIVTAQKRPERLQEIPVSVSVLSGDAVAQAHITDLSDINRAIPSVQIKATFNGRVPYGIRGISTNADQGVIGLTSGVSIQVDGVPVPADSFAANTIADVAQLEVLKGPQATLGGRTASAGVINFVTFGPTVLPHFGFNALLTDDGEHHVDVRASGQLLEGVTASITGYYQHTPYPVYNRTLDQWSNADSKGVRGKLKWEVTPDFDVQIMGHYADTKSIGSNKVPIYFTPGASFFFNGSGLDQADMLPGINIKYDNTDYASHTRMSSKYEDKDGSLVLNYYLGDSTITSTTSYSYERQNMNQDVFNVNDVDWALKFQEQVGAPALPFSNSQQVYGYIRQITEELKIASDVSRPISYLVGAWYSDTKVNQYYFRNLVINPIAKNNISSTTNYAIYGRVTIKPTDHFTVVGGLRYNWDKIGWTEEGYFNLADGIYGNGAFGNGGYTWNLHDSSSALVGDFALQYRPTRDVMVYASYTRGYKPKAFNTIHDFTSMQNAPSVSDLKFVNPASQEHINSFEMGLKSSLLDQHLTFNLAAFYTKYNGYQAQLYDLSQIIGVLVLSNADARTQGVEADLNYVKGNTRLSFSAAYIDAKFTHFPGASCYGGQDAADGCVTDTNGNESQDLSGKSMPDSPKFKLSANVQQVIPLDRFNLLLGGNLSYRTSALLLADQNPQSRQPGFALLDFSVGFQSKDKKESLTFFVNNITDHHYLTDASDAWASATTGNYVAAQPARDSHRYFGGRFSVDF